MKYKTIVSDFAYMPLAGYLMNVIELTRDKDGLDAMAFLNKIDGFISKILKESEINNFALKEFYFAINTEDDVFAMDFYVSEILVDFKDYQCEYKDTKYFRMYTENENWGLDEIEICVEDESEDEDMDNIIAMNIINITREFDKLYFDGDISNSDDAEEKIIKLAHEGKNLLEKSYIQDRLKEIFPNNRYDLVEVEVTRVRKVLEKATINIAVFKDFGDDTKREAESYVDKYLDESTALEWEVEDEEYEYDDLVVSDMEIIQTGTFEEIELEHDIYKALD